jgi:small conductance mechanosensitive channel
LPGLCKYAGIALERARSLKEIKLAATIVETGIGIAYRDDPKAAIEAITAPMKKLDFVSEKPNLQIGIERFADSAIVIGVRAWVPTTS